MQGFDQIHSVVPCTSLGPPAQKPLLGNCCCELEEFFKALNTDASDYSLAALTPVGTAFSDS